MNSFNNYATVGLDIDLKIHSDWVRCFLVYYTYLPDLITTNRIRTHETMVRHPITVHKIVVATSPGFHI